MSNASNASSRKAHRISSLIVSAWLDSRLLKRRPSSASNSASSKTTDKLIVKEVPVNFESVPSFNNGMKMVSLFI